MRPVMCMITAAVRCASEEAVLLDRISAAARAGVHLIQVRQPEMEAGALARLVRRVVEVARGTEARILVNDRADVALVAGAHGVQLRGISVAGTRVRAVAPPGFLIGRSVHAAEEGARAAVDEGLDYLLFGTVFETKSKPGAETAGPSGLAAACHAVTLPVLAVGGMTCPRLRSVAAAGAAGFAAIGLFADVSIDQIPDVVQQASAAFDTDTGLPNIPIASHLQAS